MRILMVSARYVHRGGEDESTDQEMRSLREAGHEVHDFRVQNRDGKIEALMAAGRCFGSQAVHRALVERVENYGPFDVAHLQNLFGSIGPQGIETLHDLGIPIAMSIRNWRWGCAAATLWRNGQHCRECLDATGWRRDIGWPGIRHGCYRGPLGSAAISLGRLYNRSTYDKVGVFVAVSECVRQEMIDAGADPWRVVVKPNVVCPDPGMAPPTSATHGVYAGELHTKKGVDVLLEALDFLHLMQGRQAPEIRIIGDGPLRKLVERAAAAGRVTYLGRLPHHEVLREFAAAKFGVVPSVWAEPLGRVAIEMAACGKPVTVADSGGLPETVHAPIWTHRPGDRLDLAAKISVLHAMGPAEAGWYGEKQRRHYERRFSPSVQVQHLLRVYDQARRMATYVAPEPVPIEPEGKIA